MHFRACLSFGIILKWQSVPGEGLKCGASTCHRYADCHMLFNGDDEGDAARCRCVVGYVGDGLDCQYGGEQASELLLH